jgi:hypothetical protein
MTHPHPSPSLPPSTEAKAMPAGPDRMHRPRPFVRTRLPGYMKLCRDRLGSASPIAKLSCVPSGMFEPPDRPDRTWGEIFKPWMWRMAFMAFTLALMLPMSAGAVELYSDPCCGFSTPPPPQPVIYMPAPSPSVVYVSQPAEVVVVENVTHVAVEGSPEVKVKKDLLTLIEGRGGAGMWIIPGLKEDVHLGYNLDFALAMRGFLVGLDFTWIHGIEWVKKLDELDVNHKANLAVVGMKLGYRFNEHGRVHPELAARFDTLILDQQNKGTKLAFGIGGSAALVADFPLKYGAIVTGLEVAGHRHVWSQNGFYPPRASIAVIGSVGYKF